MGDRTQPAAKRHRPVELQVTSEALSRKTLKQKLPGGLSPHRRLGVDQDDNKVKQFVYSPLGDDSNRTVPLCLLSRRLRILGLSLFRYSIQLAKAMIVLLLGSAPEHSTGSDRKSTRL